MKSVKNPHYLKIYGLNHNPNSKTNNPYFEQEQIYLSMISHNQNTKVIIQLQFSTKTKQVTKECTHSHETTEGKVDYDSKNKCKDHSKISIDNLNLGYHGFHSQKIEKLHRFVNDLIQDEVRMKKMDLKLKELKDKDKMKKEKLRRKQQLSSSDYIQNGCL